jgi:hypothetical protein
MTTPRRPISALFTTFLAAMTLILVPQGAARADVFTGTFEDQNPGVNTFRNNFMPATGFTTGGFSLNNNFNTAFSVWSGFSVSSKVDNTFGGDDFSHEYGAYAPLGAQGTGSGGSATYGVAFNFSRGDAFINLPAGARPFSIDITNTTYAAQAIVEGDSFTNHPGFIPGDFFRLDVLGFSGPNGTGTQIGSVPFYLADYRGSSLQLVSNWTTLSLTSLAGASSLAFNLTSTDVGQFGMNTPAFFAVDNVVAVTAAPEPASVILMGVGVGIGLTVWARRAKSSIDS